MTIVPKHWTYGRKLSWSCLPNPQPDSQQVVLIAVSFYHRHLSTSSSGCPSALHLSRVIGRSSFHTWATDNLSCSCRCIYYFVYTWSLRWYSARLLLKRHVFLNTCMGLRQLLAFVKNNRNLFVLYSRWSKLSLILIRKLRYSLYGSDAKRFQLMNTRSATYTVYFSGQSIGAVYIYKIHRTRPTPCSLFSLLWRTAISFSSISSSLVLVSFSQVVRVNEILWNIIIWPSRKIKSIL